MSEFFEQPLFWYNNERDASINLCDFDPEDRLIGQHVWIYELLEFFKEDEFYINHANNSYHIRDFIKELVLYHILFSCFELISQDTKNQLYVNIQSELALLFDIDEYLIDMDISCDSKSVTINWITIKDIRVENIKHVFDIKTVEWKCGRAVDNIFKKIGWECGHKMFHPESFSERTGMSVKYCTNCSGLKKVD